jgi:group II intron reverse transcriptase/maturase
MLEQIVDRRNMEKALVQVESNKGAAGIDGMKTEALRPYLNAHYQQLRSALLEGSYQPFPVRTVEIDKPGGGKRTLGIPTVVDRMIQQAIAQWMEPKYDPFFSQYSYGFRPGRSAHQAVLQAKQFITEGKVWVVELDLESFFDRVNHDRLMARLSKVVTDKGTLKLIRRYLSSGIMEGGVASPKTEGTPQGSPLSPLLSNIVLDELDKELQRRGHAFVRYADDVSVYVSSEAAAKRVIERITCYIEEKLLLKVNRLKSKISRPEESTLLGFTFYSCKGGWRIKVAKKSVERMKAKCKALTQRSSALSEENRIARLTTIIKGWVNYFAITQDNDTMKLLDGFVRARLRMCKWKEWKSAKTRIRNLLRLGVQPNDAYRWGYSRAGYCRIAHSKVLQVVLTNEYFRGKGYCGFYNVYRQHKEKQPTLF